MKSRRAWFWIIAGLIFLFGLFTRVSTALRHYPEPLVSGDEVTYYEMGANLWNHHLLSGEFPLPTAWRAPLYPVYLSLHHLLPGCSPGRVRISQSLLSSLLPPAVFLLSSAVCSPGAGLAAALILAASGRNEYSSFLQIESFYSFIILAVAFALFYRVSFPGKISAAFLGLTAGISLLCRSTLFLFPFFFLLLVLARPGLRRKMKGGAAVFLLCAYLPLLPWILRNAYQFRAFIPFEYHAATTILYTGSLGIVEGREITWAQKAAYEQYAGGTGRSGEAPRLEKLNSVMVRLAVKNIFSSPSAYLEACLKRFIFFIGQFYILFLLSAAGLWFYRDNDAHFLLAGLMAYFFIHIFMSVSYRFLAPFFPVLALLAGAGLAGLADPLLSKAGNYFPPDKEPFVKASRLAAYISTGLLALLYAAAVFFLAAEVINARRLDAALLEYEKKAAPGAAGSGTETDALLRSAGVDSRRLAAVLVERGLREYSEGRSAAALTAFKTAGLMDLDNWDAALSLAALRAVDKDTAGSLRWYERALEILEKQPDKPDTAKVLADTYLFMAELLEQGGKRGEAAAAIEKALSAAPADWQRKKEAAEKLRKLHGK